MSNVKIYWKVIGKEDRQSMMQPSLPKEAVLNYPVGIWVKPEIGGIFVFNDKDGAEYEVVTRRNNYLPMRELICVPCQIRNPRRIQFRHSVRWDIPFSEFIEFWKFVKKDKNSRPSHSCYVGSEVTLASSVKCLE